MQGRLTVLPDVLAGEAVTQPAARRSHELDVPALEPDLLLQLTIERFFRRLVAKNAALRELPAAAARAPAEKNLAIIAHQDDADVGPKPVCVDEIGHSKS